MTANTDQIHAEYRAAYDAYITALKVDWHSQAFKVAENRYWDAWRKWKAIVEPGGQHGQAV